MNTIKVYLADSGSVATLDKNFPLYQGQYQNVLLNVFVPTSILAPDFTTSVAGTAVKISMISTARNGTQIQSVSRYMRYLKTITYNSVEYALYERKLPKEFTFYAGQGTNAPKMVINVVNTTTTTVLNGSVTVGSLTLSKIEQSTFESKITIAGYYNFIYSGTEWQLNGTNVALADYGITVVGTPESKDTITVEYTPQGTILSVVTSQECNFDVMPSSLLDNDEAIQSSELESINARLNEYDELLPTDKAITTNSWQTETTIIGALNKNTEQTEKNRGNIATNASAIATNTTDIEKLKESISISETYIGQMTGSAEPTDDELNSFVQEKEGRAPRNGDVIIFIQTISGGTDKNYKYIYSSSKWISYELPPMEPAYNGSLGLVKGTYNTTSTNTTLVDITAGEITEIYEKDTTTGDKVSLGTIYGNQKNVLNGTTAVPKAMADQNGNVINTTYQTINAGASKQYVKDYALPKQFYSTYYIASDGYKEKPPTTPESGVQFSQKISGVTTGTTMFDLSRTLVADVVLNDTNSSKNSIYVSSDVDKSIQLRLTTRAKKADATAWTTLSVEVSNILTLTAGEIQRVDFESLFTSLTQVLELAENDYYGQVLEVITTDSTEFTLSIYGNSTYASSFTINTSTQQIVVQSGKLGEIPSYTLTGTKTDTTISFDLSSETKLYNNVETQFILSYDGEIADTDSLKITYGSQDIRIVTPYNLESGNATYKQLNQTRIADNTITFIGLIQIDSGSNISVVVEEDNLTATKNELNVSAKEEIILGANGTIQGNVANFVVEDSETYLPYRVNGTKFLLDLSLGVTGTLTLSDVVTITFGDTTYYLVSAYDGSTHLTLGDLEQIAKYNTTTGYRYIFDTMFYANSSITGFAIIPTIGTLKKIMLVYDGANITRNGVTQTFTDIKTLVEDKNNIVEVKANNFNVIMRYDAYEDDAIWFNSRYKINGVNYLNRLIINSSNEIIFDDDAVLTQYATMPTASESLSGVIAQYIGATNTNYTNGYFYKCSETVQDIAESLIATQINGYNLGTISVDKNEYLSGIVAKGYDHGITEEDKIEFEFRGYPEVIKCSVGEDEFVLSRASDEDVDNEVKAYAWKYDETIFYTKTKFPDGNTYFYGTSDWTNRTELNFESVTSYNETTDGYWTCNNDWYDVENELEYNIVDLADFGITFTGTATVGSKFTTQYTYPVEASNVYLWERIDVQPSTTFTIDSELSTTSENAVQNKVITTVLQGKQDTITEDNKLSNTLVSGLGTSSTLDTGTSSGNVVVVGADGKIASSIIPASAITDTFVVNSQSSMLALNAQVGDVAVRTDLNKSFILKATPATTLANWQELLTPTDAVTSVNGQTGAVNLSASDVGALSSSTPYVSSVNGSSGAITGLATTEEIENGDVTAMYSEYANQTQHSLTIKQNGTTQTFNGSSDVEVTISGGGITNHEVIDTEASLPTATETSADFVQVNGELYFKKVEEVEQLATPTNVTASGTTISFDPVENATSYEVYADGTSIGTYEV